MRRTLIWFALGFAPALACVGDDPAGTPADAGGQIESDAAPNGSSGGSVDVDAAQPDASARCEASDPFARVRPFSRVNTALPELDLRFSPDGQFAYFAREAKASQIYVASRARNFEDGTVLGETADAADSSTDNGAPTLSADGLEIVFHSTEGKPNGIRVWHATRANLFASFGNRAPIAAWQNEPSRGSPIFVADGSALYFAQRGAGTSFDIQRAPRLARGEYGTVVQMMKNGAHPAVSADELTLYFSRSAPDKNGDDLLMVATRSTRDLLFEEPTLVTLPAPATGMSARPSWLSDDGCTLVFVGPKSMRPANEDAGSPDLDIFIATKRVDELP